MIKCEATCAPWTAGSGKIIIQDCSHLASVKIDGVNLCLKHAGTIAVRKLVSIGLAEHLPRQYNQKSLCDLSRH